MKYISIAYTNLRNALAYKLDFLASGLFIALILFVFTQLWGVAFETRSSISGFTITALLWYLVMSESITTSLGRTIHEISSEVKSGEIANYFTKPYNYVLYKYSMTLGAAIIKFIITFLLASVVVLLFHTYIPFPLTALIPLLLIILLALTLHFLMMAALGLCAFWMEDTESLYFIYQKTIFVIGGMLMPLDLYPQWLQSISVKLPFSYVAYYPSKLFVQWEWSLFWNVLSIQLLWLVIIASIVSIIYVVGKQKVSINGG